MAQWRTYPELSASDIVGSDLLPLSDESQPAGSRSAVTRVDTLRAVLVAAVTINAQTGATYTLVLADAGALVTLSNGSPITLTVPTNASVAYPIGTVIGIAQLGGGLVSVEGATGVTINGVTPGDAELTGQYATASLTKLATDTWLLSGGIA